MTDIQNISFQLMKSPRELASWNFPLSEILEEYSKLLPELRNIRYSEAALVIQNSVNAYVRKVEELYDETKSFSQKIFVESLKDEIHQYKQKKEKANLDFGRFELINFNEEIGQNINLKNHKGKSLKFLHRCFSQLVNPYTRLKIEIVDRKSEIIGKKYGYRCNQQITRNGTLMEELTPKDCIKAYYNTVHSKLISPKNNNNPKTIWNDLTHESEDEFDKKDNSSMLTLRDNLLSKEKNYKSSDNDLSFYASKTSDSTLEENYILSSQLERENSCDDCSNSSSNEWEQTLDYNSCNEKVPIQSIECEIDLTEIKMSEEDCTTINTEKVQHQTVNEETTTNDTNQKIEIEVRSNNKRKKDEIEPISIENSMNHNTLRRSGRLNKKKDNPSLNCTSLLKPIPFADGIPEKTIKTRMQSEILSKRNSQKHKRKSRNKVIEVSSEENFMNLEDEPDAHDDDSENECMKMTMYSPTRSQHAEMKNEDPKGFQECFDEVFNAKNCFAVTYKPMETMTMELVSSSQDCDVKHSDLEHSNRTLNEFEDDNRNNDICLKSSQNFDKLIKHKIEKIYEELDLHTDEDHKVAKWHEQIKPRLLEAERKPPFHIHEYESRIMQRLETCNRKIQFDQLIKEEPPCEIARYFSATLQLASSNSLNIHTCEDVNKGIELILLDQEKL